MSELTIAQRTPASSPFAVLYSKQNSSVVCKMGRIKSERQTLLDATRVNPERADCASWAGMDKKAEI